MFSRATVTSTCMACRSGPASSRSCIQTVEPWPRGSTALSSAIGRYPRTARQKPTSPRRAGRPSRQRRRQPGTPATPARSRFDRPLLGLVPGVEVGGARDAERLEVTIGVGRGHRGGEADVVAAVVEHGDAFEGDPVGAGGEQGYAVRVEVDVEAGELVRVLAGDGAEALSEREVGGGQEVDGEVCGAQAHPVGVVGLRQPHAVVLRARCSTGRGSRPGTPRVRPRPRW